MSPINCSTHDGFALKIGRWCSFGLAAGVGFAGLCTKSRFISPQSGRMIVAQQFTAGIKRVEGFVVSDDADPNHESLG